VSNYLLSKIKIRGLYNSFLLGYDLGQVPPPKFVVWDCTRRCNLNCKHCGAKKEVYLKELTTSQVKDLVKKISEYKSEYFVVTGGEPLLREDIFEIFSFAKEIGLKTGIATNGFFVDKNNSKAISENFDSAQISLDGSLYVHNKIRGDNSSFQRAIEAVSFLQRAHCRQITICSVITPENFNDLNNLAKKIEELKVDIWKITSVMPIGRVEKNDNLFLNDEQFRNLLLFIKKNKKKLRIRLGENLGHLGKDDKEYRDEPFFCPVGFLTCCIGVDGSVRGCPEQPDNQLFREGNILENDFKEIWEKGFKKYRNKNFLEDKNCKKCIFKNDCRGGCWVMRLKSLQCSIMRYSLL